MAERRNRLFPPALGLLIGFLAGAIDWLLLITRLAGGGGNIRLPLSTWPTIVGTWMTIGCASGLPFAWPRLGCLRAIPLAFAAPGLLLLSRFATPRTSA